MDVNPLTSTSANRPRGTETGLFIQVLDCREFAGCLCLQQGTGWILPDWKATPLVAAVFVSSSSLIFKDNLNETESCSQSHKLPTRLMEKVSTTQTSGPHHPKSKCWTHESVIGLHG